MTSKILTVLLLSANLAAADGNADDRAPAGGDVDAAVASEREASTRERYNAQLTTIAERDIVTAEITRDTAVKAWNTAVHDNRPADVEHWSQRHAEALRDERDARQRAEFFARERDKARADFEASAEKVRRLSRSAAR